MAGFGHFATFGPWNSTPESCRLQRDDIAIRSRKEFESNCQTHPCALRQCPRERGRLGELDLPVRAGNEHPVDHAAVEMDKRPS